MKYAGYKLLGLLGWLFTIGFVVLCLFAAYENRNQSEEERQQEEQQYQFDY